MLVPQYGAAPSETLAAARASEEAGLDVWLAGQLLPMPESHATTALEPLTLMGAIAAVTRTARLGFMVLAAPYLPPLYLAKALLTLNEISGGRVEAGLGAGWRAEEFAALGQDLPPVAERLTILEAVLDALDELSGEAVESPAWPTSARAGAGRGRPPVWIAGGGRKVLELAVRRAGWTNFAKGIGVQEFAAKGLALTDAARGAGLATPGLSLTATFMIGEPDDLTSRLGQRARRRGVEIPEYEQRLRAANVFVGTPEQLAEQMREYVDVGCSAFVLWPLDGDHQKVAAPLGAAARALNVT